MIIFIRRTNLFNLSSQDVELKLTTSLIRVLSAILKPLVESSKRQLKDTMELVESKKDEFLRRTKYW